MFFILCRLQLQQKGGFMKKIDAILQSIPLFDNIDPEKYSHVLSCLNGKVQDFTKGEIISDSQNSPNSSGIVLSGKISMSMISRNGTEHYVQQFEAGDIFGEAFSYQTETQDNTVFQLVAVENCSILFLNFKNLYVEEALACPYASQVALNLLKKVVQNNLHLNSKVNILSQKKIRDRIVIYLQSVYRSGNTMQIPFNRQELANFLGVDRSALSRELSAMRDEGIIDFYKNEIILLRRDLLN